MPSPENSEKSERSGSENSKYDENSDSEHAKSKSESIKEKEESKNVEDEDKKENPESPPEKIISENKTSLDSPKGKDSKYSNTSPDSPNTSTISLLHSFSLFSLLEYSHSSSFSSFLSSLLLFSFILSSVYLFPPSLFPPSFPLPSILLSVYLFPFLSLSSSLLTVLLSPPLCLFISPFFFSIVLILPAFLSSPGLFYHFLFHSHFTCFRSVFLHPLPQGNSNSQPFSLPEFHAYSLFLSTCEANCKEVPHIVAHPSESSPSFICYLFFQFTKWRIFPSLLGNS